MNLFILIAEFIESIIGAITTLVRTFLIAPTFGYIRWLTAFVWIPEIIDITIYRDIVRHHWKIFPPLAIMAEAIGIPWDYFSVKDGLWNFPGHILDLWFLGIPVEEHLWIIFVSWSMALAVLFFYRVELRRNVRQP